MTRTSPSVPKRTSAPSISLTIVMVMEIIISDDNYMKVEIMPMAKKPILLANAGKSARVLQLISLSMTTSKEMPRHRVIVKYVIVIVNICN